MSTKFEWSHLTTPGVVRARSKELSQSHRQMMSDLIDVRIERGMTQEHVAEILGVSRQRVSKMEQYDSNPRLDTIQKYANAIGALIETHVQKDTRDETARFESESVVYRSIRVNFPQDKIGHSTVASPAGEIRKHTWSDSTHLANQWTHADFALVA
ncbi:helix-turn-helix transcriptional regulator [Glutamicibacter sp. NPDC087583]|uniref:helix-turn-helix transcriptional regulator n=1 Tax=Glutamicibacter sp. NPDC087583 TaxID=3363995 RepID=UPI003812AE82